MPSNVVHHPTVVTLSTTAALVVAAGTGASGFQVRSGLVLRNNDAAINILIYFGSLSAAAFTLGPGLTYVDYSGQDPVYAKGASGTPGLYVDPIY